MQVFGDVGDSRSFFGGVASVSCCRTSVHTAATNGALPSTSHRVVPYHATSQHKMSFWLLTLRPPASDKYTVITFRWNQTCADEHMHRRVGTPGKIHWYVDV